MFVPLRKAAIILSWVWGGPRAEKVVPQEFPH